MTKRGRLLAGMAIVAVLAVITSARLWGDPPVGNADVNFTFQERGTR